MKKLICIVTLFVIMLTSCRSGPLDETLNERGCEVIPVNKKNEIVLTKENYELYLNCSATTTLYYNSWMKCYTYINCFFDVTGNLDYSYHDVVIEVEFTHYTREGYMDYLYWTISDTAEKPTPEDTDAVTVTLNLAGNGKNSGVVFNDISESCADDSDLLRKHTLYKIVSVSGFVVKK